MPPGCRAHGRGPDHAAPVARRLTGVTASWFTPPRGEREREPADVWLHDGRVGTTRITTGTTRITTGSDRCPTVEDEPPHEDLDVGEWGRIDIRPDRAGTPFARHLGEPVLAVHEERRPLTGRLAPPAATSATPRPRCAACRRPASRGRACAPRRSPTARCRRPASCGRARADQSVVSSGCSAM
ncbi:hypothetical protein ACIQF6_31790 [Kitasatospora sp. NPDC092948]|uniref:hypothetical protein n=1 Tax=Kitasatospora sp. NPDC092948 TaxID=3364088 RepID=UPI0037FA5C60